MTDEFETTLTGLIELELEKIDQAEQKTAQTDRIYHGMLLQMINIGEDEQGINIDQLAILKEIFDRQLKLKTRYSNARSYAESTVELFQTLLRSKEKGVLVERTMRETLQEESYLFLPAYSEFADIITATKESLKEFPQGWTAQHIPARFITPLKPFLGIVTPSQEEVIKDHFRFKHRDDLEGCDAELKIETEKVVRLSEANRTRVTRKSNSARNLMKSLLHECYADDGRADYLERTVVDAIGDVIGNFTTPEISEIEEEMLQEDQIQRTIIDDFVKDRDAEQILRNLSPDATKGPDDSQLEEIYWKVMKGTLYSEDIEEFIIENEGNIDLPSQVEVETEDDIVLTAREMSNLITQERLPPDKFKKEMKKYWQTADDDCAPDHGLAARVLQNLLKFQVVLDIAYEDNVITAKEHSMLRYAAKHIYGIRDDLVFEKMLARYNSDKTVAICSVDNDPHLAVNVRNAGYIVASLPLKDLFNVKDGRPVNEWIIRLNTNNPEVIIIDNNILSPKKPEEDTAELFFSQPNRYAQVPETDYHRLIQTAKNTVMQMAEHRNISLVNIAIPTDKTSRADTLERLAQIFFEREHTTPEQAAEQYLTGTEDD